ncbi:NAD(P)-binding domain-containing protein, partial [Robbsia andropogonis]|uniref:NAD(P)-binding domain-containing protein n=1 Tax=Robbsia andropogonis TaxID=28092 RepID=UPI00056B59A5
MNIVFIGGGNMASAMIGGLLKQGHPASAIHVVDRNEEARARTRSDFGTPVSESLADDAARQAVSAADVIVLAG